MTLRKKLAVVISAVVVGVGIGWAAASATTTSSAPSIPYPPCFGLKPTLHAQIPNHIGYECVGLGATTIQGVGVYWSDNLYNLNYNWHPGHGQMVVTESFDKSCAEVSLERHGAPCGLYANLPTNDTTPGQDSYANGRWIEMADGCIPVAPTDKSVPPTTCAVVIQGGGGTILPGRPMNAQEQLSINGYWSIMNRYTPDEYW